jgi:hypothetical protein
MPYARALSPRSNPCFSTSVGEARIAVFNFIEGFYNPLRRHSSLRYLSPVDYDARAGARSRYVSLSSCSGRQGQALRAIPNRDRPEPLLRETRRTKELLGRQHAVRSVTLIPSPHPRLRQRSVGCGIASRRHRDDRASPSQQTSYPEWMPAEAIRKALGRALLRMGSMAAWEYYPQNFLGLSNSFAWESSSGDVKIGSSELAPLRFRIYLGGI